MSTIKSKQNNKLVSVIMLSIQNFQGQPTATNATLRNKSKVNIYVFV